MEGTTWVCTVGGPPQGLMAKMCVVALLVLKATHRLSKLNEMSCRLICGPGCSLPLVFMGPKNKPLAFRSKVEHKHARSERPSHGSHLYYGVCHAAVELVKVPSDQQRPRLGRHSTRPVEERSCGISAI